MGHQGPLTYAGADKGSRPPAPRAGRNTWVDIFGAVGPARGPGAALVLPCATKAAMTWPRAETGPAVTPEVTPGAQAVVIPEGAGWPEPGGKLPLPDKVSTRLLPACCPEPNPQANTWHQLRQTPLSHRVLATCAAIVDACCAAGQTLMEQPERITSIASREWASRS
jgi:hypothetical protein